jgi:hypothetical protein
MSVMLPLLAVAIGWLLNELSSLIRLRREDRRSAGPVLTDLLEIRHKLITLNEAVKEYLKELGKHGQLSPPSSTPGPAVSSELASDIFSSSAGLLGTI